MKKKEGTMQKDKKAANERAKKVQVKKEKNVDIKEPKASKSEATIKAEIEQSTEEIRDSEYADLQHNHHSEYEEIHPDDCCHIHDHKCKFGFACFAIILVSACAIAEYFFANERYSKLSKSNDAAIITAKKSGEKIQSLDQRLDQLNARLVQLESVALSGIASKKANLKRYKWKVWMALKKKIESGEPFNEELSLFNKTFAYDNELLQMIAELIRNLEGTPIERDDSAMMEAVKNYVNRVVKVRKINHRKFLEISGHVLTSEEGN